MKRIINIVSLLSLFTLLLQGYASATDIEAKQNNPKTAFCNDVKAEYDKVWNSNDPRIIKVKGISPSGKKELPLSIIQSTTVRAPKVPALNSLFRCPGDGSFWIIEKVEKSGATYTLTLRGGRSFEIVSKTDLSSLVDIPQSTVLISYVDAD